jgi:hypothetical protein
MLGWRTMQTTFFSKLSFMAGVTLALSLAGCTVMVNGKVRTFGTSGGSSDAEEEAQGSGGTGADGSSSSDQKKSPRSIAEGYKVHYAVDMGFAPEDSLRLDKVKQAFAKARGSDLIVAEIGTQEYGPTRDYKSTHGIQNTEDVPHQLFVFANAGGELEVNLTWGPSHKTRIFNRGLVWNQTKSGAYIFVTPDGGRYFLPESYIHPTEPPPKDFVVNYIDFLDRFDIEELAKIGELPKKSDDDVKAASKAFDTCVKPINDWANAQYRAIDAADLRESTRVNRKRQVDEQSQSRTEANCKKHVERVRAAMNAAIEIRSEKRRAIFEANKGRR